MTINMKFGGHFQTNRYRCLISIGKRFHPKAELIQNSGWNRKSEGVCTGGTGPCGAAEAEGEPPGVHYSCWVLPCRRTRWCLMCMYANSSLYIYIYVRDKAGDWRNLQEPLKEKEQCQFSPRLVISTTVSSFLVRYLVPGRKHLQETLRYVAKTPWFRFPIFPVDPLNQMWG